MKQRMIIMNDLQDLEIPENINTQINETLDEINLSKSIVKY